MNSILNHVAILVENIETALAKCYFPSHLLCKIEEFESEGTRELYIGSNKQMGRLLLIQANRAGPYHTALNKRGPGLHHIALDVLNIDEYVASLTGSGWFLHPKSLEFYKSHKQVFLSRPGVPVLIEIQHKEKLIDNNYFIEELCFPFQEERLINSLVCDRLKVANEIIMRIEGREVIAKSLLE
jgi:hypothetical protein